MLEVLVNIDGAEIQDDKLIIEERDVAYRIALSILTTLALTDKKENKKDDRPYWPSKK